MKVTLAVIFAGLALVNAAVVQRANPTAVSAASISSFKPFSHFAAAGYCKPGSTINWSCGGNCQSLSGFVPTASGGDGSSVQFWFVGYHPPLGSVIVVHQGTDPAKIQADLHDAEAFLGSLDPALFPGVSSSVKVHDGFRDVHQSTASAILSAVKTTMSKHGTTKVTTVGHSLGAALSMLDALFLKLHLPSSTTIKFVGYGTPRVGNPDWADLIDALLPDLTRVNNKQDLVPILPGRFLGYAHPRGEIHIQASGAWVSCALPDDTTAGCTIDSVPNIFDGSVADHDGPYDGVNMAC